MPISKVWFSELLGTQTICKMELGSVESYSTTGSFNWHCSLGWIILFEGSSFMNILITDEEGHGLTTDFTKPGIGLIYEIKKDNSYTIELRYTNTTEDEKGTIWINPSWRELKVDLNKAYEWKFNFATEYRASESKLIYSVDNADKSAKFNFTYSKELRQDLPNPFEVCHGQDCKNNIETYDFEKGQSYKIYVKVAKMKDGILDNYYLPSFKFGDINGKWSYSFNLRINMWIISLLLLLII
jgi:hypothetical protein